MTILRILMLNYEFPPIGGGAANAHLALLKEYAKDDRLKIDVLTSAPKPGFYEEKFSNNIIIYKVGLHKKQLHYWRKTEVIEWLIKARRRYRKLLNQNSYDLVHTFFAFPSGYLCYKTADKAPYIISLRGSDVPGAHARLQMEYKILAGLFRSIWQKASLLVGCSEGLKQRALRFMSSAQVEVIPNGVDIERFSPAENTNPTEALRLITVGRLSATKRIDMLIEAVKILSNSGRKVHLTIAGGGSLKHCLRQLVAGKNLADNIEFAGRVDAQYMPELYKKNDLYVSATMQEGMSNAMLEAMASGLPIITTKCEGLEELINDNGIVVETAEAENIANAILAIASDKILHKKMSAAARKKAEDFTWKKVAEQYTELYEKAVK